MLSYSEGSSLSFGMSTIFEGACQPLGDPHPTTAEDRGHFEVDDLAQLADLLSEPGSRAWALAATKRDNVADKVQSGTPSELIRIGLAQRSELPWAIVVRPHPSLIVYDLDECSGLVLPDLLEATAEAGATVVARVASGRPDCCHLWIAPPTAAARQLIEDRAHWLRRTHDLAPDALDDRSGRRMRLPGSPSLKARAHPAILVHPETGDPEPASAAVARVQSFDAPPAEKPTRRHPRRKPRRPALGQPLPDVDTAIDAVDGFQTVSPRAWRRRTPLTTEDWKTLTTEPLDDRSAAATRAAWVLWRHGVRSEAAAVTWYRQMPAFTKFTSRETDPKTGSPNWVACRAHWRSIVDRAKDHRPHVSEKDTSAIALAREEIPWITDPRLQAAAHVILARVFDTGHGITDRPIARRDIQSWLHVADGVATQILRGLTALGFLTVCTPWSPTAPRRATTYSLGVPAKSTRGDRAHDVTPPSVAHPLWGLLGHPARRLWELLRSSRAPLPLRTLAESLGLPPGDHSFGTRRLLALLQSAGLVRPSSEGRTQLWALDHDVTLDAAAERTGADRRARELAARLVGERKAWHAESRTEGARALRGLAVLRTRLTHRDAVPAGRGSYEPRVPPHTVSPSSTGPSAGNLHQIRSGRLEGDDGNKLRGKAQRPLRSRPPSWGASSNPDPGCPSAHPVRRTHQSVVFVDATNWPEN